MPEIGFLVGLNDDTLSDVKSLSRFVDVLRRLSSTSLLFIDSFLFSYFLIFLIFFIIFLLLSPMLTYTRISLPSRDLHNASHRSTAYSNRRGCIPVALLSHPKRL